jgi:hypothetical protein
MKIVKKWPWIDVFLNDGEEATWDYDMRSNTWYHYCDKSNQSNFAKEVNIPDSKNIICQICKETLLPAIVFQVKLRILE